MAKRPRLTKIFDMDLIPALLARRRIASRLCMGQGVVEMARLEGVPVARMIEITDHPIMMQLAKTWMAYLRRIEGNRDIPRPLRRSHDLRPRYQRQSLPQSLRRPL